MKEFTNLGNLLAAVAMAPFLKEERRLNRMRTASISVGYAGRRTGKAYPFASKRQLNWSDRRAQGGPGLDENNDPRKAV